MNNIILYTKPNCGPCAAVKRYLQVNGIPYTELGPQEAIEAGYKSVPVLLAAGHKAVFGFNLPELNDFRDFYTSGHFNNA